MRFCVLVCCVLALTSASDGRTLAQAGSGARQRPGQSISPRDCLIYNAEALRTERQYGSWKITDGNSSLMSFDNEMDAKNGLALARRYGLQCFVGRHQPTLPADTLTSHVNHVVTYWEEPTNAKTTIAPEHCVR